VIPEITVQELKKLRDDNADIMILDVRDAWEYKARNLGGKLMPLKELPDHISELDKNKKIIVHCQMGGRSSRATAYLLDQGFKNVFNLRGGIQAWALEIDPSMPHDME
jgi:rhodanese-related sulfurtransferase